MSNILLTVRKRTQLLFRNELVAASVPPQAGEKTRCRKSCGPLCLAILCWCIDGPASAGVADAAEEPLYLVTHVDVLPKFTKTGRDLLNQFAVDSRKDAGAVRVEVYEDLSRRNHSTVVEAWSSRKACDDHLAADHARRSGQASTDAGHPVRRALAPPGLGATESLTATRLSTRAAANGFLQAS